MFHQVRVPPSDRDYLRFFWWPGGNVDSEPVEYRMTVHLFGATSSPSVCNYALKQATEDFAHKYDPSISKLMTSSMYVDDCLASLENEVRAIETIKNITSMCKDAGFKMTKWNSNRPSVIQSIPEEDRGKEVQLWSLEDKLPVERALGVRWNMETDVFEFVVKVNEKPPTRRNILSITSSIYDPIGIVSPFVLIAKSILQDVCKKGYGWDQELESDEIRQWNNWLNQLNELERIKLQRCYKPTDFGNVQTCQLHCFSDASETGYGVVFYLRMIDELDQTYCSFVMGKSRVTPLKKITIPRLELTAATTSVRLSKIILEELNINVDKVYFWTDSMTVLRYICNRNTRFHTFVANRLALIHESTSNDQWNYVNTKINPADLASRGMTVVKFEQCPQWFKGPDFLWLPEEQWPQTSENLEISNDDDEVKHVVNSVSNYKTTEKETDGIEKLLSKVSNVHKLRRIIAWMLRFIRKVRTRIEAKQIGEPPNSEKNKSQKYDSRKNLQLDLEDIQQSDNVLIRFVQNQHFEDDLSRLQTGTHVKQSSKLCKLDPFIDQNGIIRVGGRLRRSDLSDNMKYPIILPKDSEISHLIIRDIHQKIGHLGKNSILAHLREKYWVIGANSIIKGLVSKCVICRKYQAPIAQQKMADLPDDRITPDMRPFTAVGIDYFGPFEIKQRRSSVKRYGVIFTCLKMRAIHLEIANSLDTDSCINAIRRFIARRGKPSIIRSDNGTNFVGAQRELKEEIDNWNYNQINEFMLQQNIDWRFNPPAASNFGGVWERLIRSVRKVLYSILKEQNVRLDDENLHTLFCEVETILNGRPITAISDDVNDLKVLTPNDLLLIKNESLLPPGIFVKTDNYVKRRWRQVQYLADLFWHRWSREYLPLLQERSKWKKSSRNLQVGDLVLIVDNTPRHSWTIGRIVEVKEDNLGAVRIAKVKTANSTLERSVSKLCLVLESDIDHD